MPHNSSSNTGETGPTGSSARSGSSAPDAGGPAGSGRSTRGGAPEGNRGDDRSPRSIPKRPKLKAGLVLLSDGNYLTPEGQILDAAQAKAQGFSIPGELPPSVQAAVGAARAQQRARLGSLQTTLGGVNTGLGVSNIRRRSLSAG